jgi:hypothetical protein
MTRGWVVSIVSVLLSTSISSCSKSGGVASTGSEGSDGSVGADGPAASCPRVRACGGDIVGTWKFSSACVSAPESLFDAICGTDVNLPGCSTATVSSSLTATGTYVFATDMSYLTDVRVSGTVVFGLPSFCLRTFDGRPIPCDEVASNFDLAVPGFAPAPSARCVSTDAGCTCTMTLAGPPVGETGTFATSSTGLLSLTPTASFAPTGCSGSTSPTQNDYCVSGNVLTVWPQSGSTVAGWVRGSITATKQ